MSFPLPIHHSRLSKAVQRQCSFQFEKIDQLELHAKVDPPSQIAKPPSVLKKW
jgi:hypothetical protein